MDGVLDVIVGTGLGFLYVLSGDTGKLRRGFPVEMGPIQAGVACGDLLGDGSMAIVACDTLGNVAAFNAGARVQWSQFVCNSQSCMFFSAGAMLWDRVVSGSVSQAPTLADLDGDGTLEVVCATSSGDIVVLKGKDGSYMPNFPVRTGDRIISPVLVLPFPEDAMLGGSQGEYAMPRLLVPSFDGLVYIVSSQTGCTDWVDIGEQAYSMPLVSDLDGNGYLDLLLTTMNGNAFALQTEIPFDPMLTWQQQVQCGRNGATWR